MLLLCLPAAAQDVQLVQHPGEDAGAVVAKAVKALGGASGIQKLRTAQVDYTLAIFGNAGFMGIPGGMSATVEETYDLPRRIKKVVDATANGMGKGRVSWAIDGQRLWTVADGKPVHVQGPVADPESTFRPFQVIELLAQDDLAHWSLPPPGAVKDDDSIAVIATNKATGGEVTFYFDKSTALLLRVAGKRTLPKSPVEVDQVTEFSSYKEIDGVQLPMEQTMIHDGKKTAHLRVTDVHFFDHMEDYQFASPGSGFVHAVAASALAIGVCLVVGWLIGARSRRNEKPPGHAVAAAAVLGGIAGAILGVIIVRTVQSAGLDTDPATPGNLALWLALCGACAGLAGAAFGNRRRR
jgi:hypothetical protein